MSRASSSPIAAPHHPAYRAAIVPTLEDTIRLCLNRNLGLVLELKPIWGAGLETARVVADPTTRIDILGVGTFHLNYQFALKRGINGLLATGARVAVATVNAPETARRLLAMGAQGVMTNTIGLLGQDQAAGGKGPSTSPEIADRLIYIVRNGARVEILPHFRNRAAGSIVAKTDPSDLVTIADRATEARIT